MESFTSLLGCFEGRSLFLLLLLEDSVLLANLLLFLLGILARLWSATRLPERFDRISWYLEGLELSFLATTHFCTVWNNWGEKPEEAVKSKVRFTLYQLS